MTQKIKDLLHAIMITIFAIICLTCCIGGTVYLIATSSGTIASVLASAFWSLIWLLGSALFTWGAVTGWKEWIHWYKNKEE